MKRNGVLVILALAVLAGGFWLATRDKPETPVLPEAGPAMPPPATEPPAVDATDVTPIADAPFRAVAEAEAPSTPEAPTPAPEPGPEVLVLEGIREGEIVDLAIPLERQR